MIFLKKQHEKGLSWLITIFILRQLDINLHAFRAGSYTIQLHPKLHQT